MKNSKIEASFENKILSVNFLENAIIDVSDLQEIYAFANEKANGKTYGVIFQAIGHYEVTEDAIKDMADETNNTNVVAKVYIINTKEAERKTKLHLLFDEPELKPNMFKTFEEGISWLKNILDKN